MVEKEMIKRGGKMSSWNKGIPHSEETKKKMSDAHKGKYMKTWKR